MCAVFGGLLASEMLKILSGQDEPWPNVHVYNAQTSESVTVMVEQVTVQVDKKPPPAVDDVL